MNKSERAVIGLLQSIALKMPTYKLYATLGSSVAGRDACAGSYRTLWRKNLELAGFKALGTGAFGIAVSSPCLEGKVVKIVPGEDCWVHYARVCFARKEELERNCPGISAYLLNVQYLETFSGCTIGLIEQLGSTLNEWQQLNPLTMQEEKALTERHWSLRYGLSGSMSKHEEYRKEYNIGKALRGFAPPGAGADLHGNNIMLRSDGQWVITDPWS